MPVGIGIQIDDLLGRKKRQRREGEAAAMAKSLMDDGNYTPDEINQIASRYLKTGEFQGPTMRTKELPPMADIPERSTRVPISFKKKKGLLGYTDDGKVSDLSNLIEGYDEVNTVKLGGERNGRHIILNKKTGEVISSRPNGQKHDTYAYPDRPAGGAGGESPDVQLAKDTIKKYQDAKKRDLPLDPEFIESARSAFEMLNIPFEEEEKPATLIDKVQNAASGVTKGKIPAAETRYGDPIADFSRSNDAKKLKATEWLKARKQKVTPANVAAVIRAGKVD